MSYLDVIDAESWELVHNHDLEVDEIRTLLEMAIENIADYLCEIETLEEFSYIEQ